MGADPQSVDALLDEAQRALELGAQGEVTPRLEALLSEPLDDARRSRLLLSLARAYPRLGRAQEAVRMGTEAVRLAERLGSRELLCDARSQLAFVYAHLAVGREALEQALMALDLARRLGDAQREAWALARVGNAYAAMDNPAQARETTQQAREIAQAHGFQELDFACLNNQAYFTLDECEQLREDGLWDQSQVVQAMAQLLAEQAMLRAQSQSNSYREAIALSNLIEALLLGGDVARAEPLLEHLDQMSQEHDYRVLQQHGRLQRAQLARAEGRSAEAIALAEALLTQPQLQPRLRRRALRLLYESHKSQGDAAAALDDLEHLVLAERQAVRAAQLVQTQVLLIRQEVDQALARAEHARADAQRERERARALELEQQVLREQLARTDRAAREDLLTRLANRRHADQALPLLLQRADEAGLPFALALLDIDHFKAVNDRFGHARGDDVLRELAALLRQRLRSADLLARWGGEEFLIALLGPAAEDAAQVFERLRAAVEAHPWGHVVAGLQLTVSLGVARRGRGSCPLQAGAAQLLQAADVALYRAKAEGRNRVCLS